MTKAFLTSELLLRPFALRAQSAHFRVASYLHAAHFGDELRLLPVLELGADTQLLGRLRAAAFGG